MALPAEMAEATRARMNSSQCLWSSRETSQKLTAKRTRTAATAVTPSSNSRCTGAISSTTVASTHVRAVATSAAITPAASGFRYPLARPALSAPRRIASSSTTSTPSRNRIVKEKRKASRGAANPLAASVRSTSTSPEWISAAFDRISDSGASSRIPLRSFAKLNSRSSTRFGSRSRSGTSASSKWSR